MSDDRAKGRKANRRAFRPSMDTETLETRVLMSGFRANTVSNYVQNQYLLTHPNFRNAVRANNPKFTTPHAPAFRKTPAFNKGVADVQTAAGGASAIVATPNGTRFRVTVGIADNAYGSGLITQTGGSGNLIVQNNQYQSVGTVRVYAMPGGKVGLIVDGTNAQSQLTIDPLPVTQRKGYAHSFAYGQAGRTHLLNIGALNVTSGEIGGILGFHSADLSGPLVVGGTTTVDRIAFNSLQPGASIAVGGSLNTLDIAEGVNLTSGEGITVGRDLNLFNVGQDVVLTNGASLKVGRSLGLIPQPPKGTGTGSNVLSLNQSQVGSGTSFGIPSVSANILGDLTLGVNSSITAQNIASSSIVTPPSGQALSVPTPTVFLVNGRVNADGGTINIPGLNIQPSFIQNANFVIRNQT